MRDEEPQSIRKTHAFIRARVGLLQVRCLDPAGCRHSVCRLFGTDKVGGSAPSIGAHERASCDVAPGILSQGSTLLNVTELARNVHWTSQDPAVAAALQAIIAGSQKPDEYLYSESFIPGGQGGVRPRYANDAPAAPLSRASAVAGALARAGGAAIQAVASRMPPGAPVYVAGGWARSQGWIDIKKAVVGTNVHVIPEPEVTAVGAALLAAHAIDWRIPARTALSLQAANF